MLWISAWIPASGLASVEPPSCCEAASQDGSENAYELTSEERRLQDVCSQLNCLCAGCRAQLSNCPHVQCGFAVGPRARDLHQQAKASLGSRQGEAAKAFLVSLLPESLASRDTLATEIDQRLSRGESPGQVLDWLCLDQLVFGDRARDQVKYLLDQGLTDQQVLDRMAESHGTEILGKPPAKGTNLGAYLIPVLFVFGGGIGAVFMLRAWKRHVPTDDGSRAPRPDSGSSEADDRIEAHLANLD
ncbi:MAG: cytochrome c-type biogenesis protein CcmH [Planctomycetota bacterium]